MLFKPKGWEKLSAEDQAWMKGAKNLDKVQKLRACVKDNNPARVLFLLNAHSFSRQEYYRTARLAVLEHAPEALQALLDKNKGFNFADSGEGDKEAAGKLFQIVPPDAFHLWKILHDANQAAEYGQLNERDIIENISPEMSHDFFRFHLDRADAASISTFRTFVGEIGLQSTEKLKFILNWAGKFPAAQKVLDSALAGAAEAGDEEKVKLLLEKKANPNYSGCVSLLHAVEKGHQEIIGLLLPHMQLETYGENLMDEMRKKRINPSKIEWLEKIVDQACAEVRVKKNQENFMLVDADTLSETKQLPSGLRLTTLFNFKSHQQTLIVEKAGEKESLAVTVKDFNEIGDDAFLEAMRLKLVELGGKAESVTRLPKTKFTRD
ncbi:MAG: ankyrin repeat domain-containing protein [Alphaproteobacteria bacterium]|nr:ankyrin repeat domain-containing protein [Alphaproteobacteria bacterium]